MENKKYAGLTILQLLSPDVVAYNTLDKMFEDEIKASGTNLIQIALNEIHI